MVEVFGRELRLGGLRHPEEHGVVGRNRPHVFLEAVQNALLLLAHAREEAGFTEMGLAPARRGGGRGGGGRGGGGRGADAPRRPDWCRRCPRAPEPPPAAVRRGGRTACPSRGGWGRTSPD